MMADAKSNAALSSLRKCSFHFVQSVTKLWKQILISPERL